MFETLSCSSFFVLSSFVYWGCLENLSFRDTPKCATHVRNIVVLIAFTCPDLSCLLWVPFRDSPISRIHVPYMVVFIALALLALIADTTPSMMEFSMKPKLFETTHDHLHTARHGKQNAVRKRVHLRETLRKTHRK